MSIKKELIEDDKNLLFDDDHANSLSANDQDERKILDKDLKVMKETDQGIIEIDCSSNDSCFSIDASIESNPFAATVASKVPRFSTIHQKSNKNNDNSSMHSSFSQALPPFSTHTADPSAIANCNIFPQARLTARMKLINTL